MAEFEFHREEDGSLPLESAVFQALGAASTCWENLSGTGIFNDRRAVAIGRALLEEINGNNQAPLASPGA